MTNEPEKCVSCKSQRGKQGVAWKDNNGNVHQLTACLLCNSNFYTGVELLKGTIEFVKNGHKSTQESVQCQN